MTVTPDPIDEHPEIDFPIKVDASPAITTFPSGITYGVPKPPARSFVRVLALSGAANVSISRVLSPLDISLTT